MKKAFRLYFTYYIETAKGGIEVDTLNRVIRVIKASEMEKITEGTVQVKFADALREYNHTLDEIRSLVFVSIEANLEHYNIETSEN